MAVTANTLLAATYNGTDGTSFTTASVSPTPGRLLLLAVGSYQTAGNPASPSSISGAGITWVSVGTALNGITRITLYRGMSIQPSSGALTISFAATHAAAAWTLTEFGNVDQTGTNGSGAVKQFATNTISSQPGITVTLAAFTNTGSFVNATYGAVACNPIRVLTEGSGFTQLGEVSGSSPNATLGTEWKTTNDTTVDWSTGSDAAWCAIAVEIVESTPATYPQAPTGTVTGVSYNAVAGLEALAPVDTTTGDSYGAVAGVGALAPVGTATGSSNNPSVLIQYYADGTIVGTGELSGQGNYKSKYYSKYPKVIIIESN